MQSVISESAFATKQKHQEIQNNDSTMLIKKGLLIDKKAEADTADSSKQKVVTFNIPP